MNTVKAVLHHATMVQSVEPMQFALILMLVLNVNVLKDSLVLILVPKDKNVLIMTSLKTLLRI